MGKISDYIKNNIVAPEVRSGNNCVIASVLSYDKSTNKAEVKYSNDNMSDNYIIIKNVNVALEGEGIVSSPIQVGDLVLINLISKDVPIIVSKIDEDIVNRRAASQHSRKGSSIPYYSMGGI